MTTALGTRKVTVLHVAGAGRSGSTLLGALLGQVDGFFNVGELGYMWDRGLTRNGTCGCGVEVRTCAVWSAVLDLAFDSPDATLINILRQNHEAAIRGRDVQALHLTGHLRRTTLRRIGLYPALLERVYQAVAEVTGCRVVVDTTKPVTYGHILEQLPSLDLRVAHLVRDPRAVAWSWSRVKTGAESGADAMVTRQALTSALLWRAGNGATARLWERAGDRYLAVRYEDLVTDPGRWLRMIVRLADQREPGLPLADERTALLSPTHTVAGNVDRHRTGRVELRLDDEWARSMPRPQRRLVAAATFPMRLRYGY